MGYRPWEFWAMTPAEFNVALRAEQERWNQARRVDAWKLHHLIAWSGNVKRGHEHKIAASNLLRTAPGYLDDVKMETIFGGD